MPRQLPKITGKQVNLILALFGKAGIYGDTKILEYIEYECHLVFYKLEDIDTGSLEIILSKLRNQFNLT